MSIRGVYTRLFFLVPLFVLDFEWVDAVFAVLMQKNYDIILCITHTV